MTKASDNLFPSVLMQNTSNSAIGTPSPWNAQRLFFDADGSLKRIDANDNVQAVEGGGTITFGGVSSTDTVTVASNFAVSDQGGGTARLDVFFPASGGGGSGTASACKVYRNTTQALTSATLTPVQFNAEELDTDGYHDNVTNNTRMTVPSGKGGIFLLSGYIFSPVTASTVALARFYKNGTTTIRGQSFMNAGANGVGFVINGGPVSLADGDYIELVAYLGTNANIGDASNAEQQCFASMTRIGDAP